MCGDGGKAEQSGPGYGPELAPCLAWFLASFATVLSGPILTRGVGRMIRPLFRVRNPMPVEFRNDEVPDAVGRLYECAREFGVPLPNANAPWREASNWQFWANAIHARAQQSIAPYRRGRRDDIWRRRITAERVEC